MKKIVSTVIAAVMALSVMPAYAQDGKTAEFLKTVKDRIEIPEALEKFESRVSEDEDGVLYRFEWSSDNEYVTVNCNDEKVITYYNHYKEEKWEGNDEPAFPKTDSESLRKIAEAFAVKANPSAEFKVTGENNDLYGKRAFFNIQSTEDGTDIAGENGYIEVNTEDMSVTSMRFPYSKITAFDGKDAGHKTEDEAKSAFTEKLGFKMVYQGYYKDGKQCFFPAYINDNGSKYISAVTGEVFEYEPQPVYRGLKNESMASAKDAGGGSNFTPAEQAELDKIAGLLSKSQIENKIRSNGVVTVPKSYKMTGISLERLFEDENVYRYSLTFSDDENYISAQADAKTGEIYNISTYGDWEELKDADQKTTEKTVAALTPSISGKYTFDGKQMSRYENGITVYGDCARVYTDKNGKVKSYYINYTLNGEFPSIDNALSAEEAAKKFFEYAGYSKKYLVNSDNKAYLVYDFDKSVTLNALTGKEVGYDGEEVTNNEYKYSDIDNHYAKEYIEKLAQYGIGFSGGEFKPNAYITEKEFSELMGFLHIYNGGGEDVLLTRENAAIDLVKAIGLDGAAKYNDIFVQSFNDVVQNKGYIAILKAMGIFGGDENGNFNPQNNLTRGEAAVMIYKYLSR